MNSSSKVRFHLPSFAGGAASAVVAIALIAALAGGKSSAPTVAVTSSSPPVGAAAPKRLEDATEFYVTTAADLAAAYAANEVATDAKIAGRPVLVSGVVQAIEKDFLGAPVVAIALSNPYMPARMGMDKAGMAAIAELKRGQKIDVACVGMSFLLGVPSGRDCKLADVTRTGP